MKEENVVLCATYLTKSSAIDEHKLYCCKISWPSVDCY